MKVRDEVDVAGGFSKEHGYLGEAKKHITLGHVPQGKVTGEGDGTSLTQDQSGGVIQKIKKFRV